MIYRGRKVLAQGNLDNGSWTGTVNKLPKETDSLFVDFAGDPITSFNVNFKPSRGKAKIVHTKPNLGPAALFSQQKSDEWLISSSPDGPSDLLAIRANSSIALAAPLDQLLL